MAIKVVLDKCVVSSVRETVNDKKQVKTWLKLSSSGSEIEFISDNDDIDLTTVLPEYTPLQVEVEIEPTKWGNSQMLKVVAIKGVDLLAKPGHA